MMKTTWFNSEGLSGYVDVLSLRRDYNVDVVVTTPSYSSGHYDKERLITITDDSNNSINTSTNHDHDISVPCWKKFEFYVCNCIPVKISQIHDFRDVNLDHVELNENVVGQQDEEENILNQSFNTEMHQILKPSCCQHEYQRTKNANDDGNSQIIIHDEKKRKFTPQHDTTPVLRHTNFPLHVLKLDPMITIQLQPVHASRQNLTNKDDQDVDIIMDDMTKQQLFMQKLVMNALTVSPSLNDTKEIPNKVSSPMFYGQEQQITTQIPLGDIFHHDSKYNNSNQYAACVAQETIVSSRDNQHQTHEPNQQHTANHALLHDQHQVGNNSCYIACQSDGKMNLLSNPSSNEKILITHSLSCLLPHIRAPAYLLPSSHTKIIEVNFWYAPKSSITNNHYDGNHNILIVYNGIKTVELSPPNSITPSEISSDHANHPLIMRPNFWVNTTQSRNHRNHKHYYRKEDDSNLICNTQLKSHRDRYIANTIVVSVRAGEALFIPEGWWHRIESSDDCMAINYWFDHVDNSSSSFIDSYFFSTSSTTTNRNNTAMLPYYVREVMRNYTNYRLYDVAEILCALERDSITKTLNEKILRHDDPDASVHLTRLNKVTLLLSSIKDENTKYCVKDFKSIFPDNKEILLYTDDILTWILLSADMNCQGHRELIISLFEDISHSDAVKTHISKTLFQLSDAVCFKISEVWNSKENSTRKCHEQVLNNCDEEVLNHIQQCYELFKKTITEYIIKNELSLCH